MNPLTKVKNLNKMNERELQMGVVGSAASWHDQYKNSAWIFVGGLPFELTEGDVLCVFSQYGEPVTINMVRDKQTGKSKGFAFICYEDQRSTILAVDNLNGSKVCGRTLRVDHVEEYRKPKDRGDEDEITMQLRTRGLVPDDDETKKGQNQSDLKHSTSRHDDEKRPESGKSAKHKEDKSHSKKQTQKKRSPSRSASSSDSEEDKRKRKERSKQKSHSERHRSAVKSSDGSSKRRSRSHDRDAVNERRVEKARSRSPKRKNTDEREHRRKHSRSRSRSRSRSHSRSAERDRKRHRDDTSSRRREDKDRRSGHDSDHASARRHNREHERR